MRNPFRKPTPLEVATSDYIGAQHALLTARLTQERANAEVSMFVGRVARLRATVRELTAEEGKPEVTP